MSLIKKAYKTSFGSQSAGQMPRSEPASSNNSVELLPRSFSTAEIGKDSDKDEKRAAQMRKILRQAAQPKSETKSMNPRDQRRKQVDAIYNYLEVMRILPILPILPTLPPLLSSTLFRSPQSNHTFLTPFFSLMLAVGWNATSPSSNPSEPRRLRERKQEVPRLAANGTQVPDLLYANIRTKHRRLFRLGRGRQTTRLPRRVRLLRLLGRPSRIAYREQLERRKPHLRAAATKNPPSFVSVETTLVLLLTHRSEHFPRAKHSHTCASHSFRSWSLRLCFVCFASQ